MSQSKLIRPMNFRHALRREQSDVSHMMRITRKTGNNYNAKGFHYGNGDRIKEVVLLEAFDHKCFYCDKVLTFDTATRDHLVPKAIGGKGTLDNLVLCCYICNQMKWDDCATEDEINRAYEILHNYRKKQQLMDLQIHSSHRHHYELVPKPSGILPST